MTASPGTDLWRQQYAMAIRTDFGLPADAQSIALAAADPSSSDVDLGTPLTQAEIQVLNTQDAASQHVADVASVARAALPEAFATAYYDYANGGMTFVGFTGAGCPTSTLIAQLQAATTSPLRVVRALHDATESQLATLQQRLDSDDVALRAQGILINRTALEPSTDSLQVTLDPSSATDSQSRLLAAYGQAGLVFTGSAPPSQVLSNRLNPPAGSPVYGGQDITNGNAACTANISANDGNGNWYVITDGHCFQEGDFVSQNDSDSPDSGTPHSGLNAYNVFESIGKVGHNPVAPNVKIKCDCVAIGPLSPDSQRSQLAVVNGEKLFKFNYFASSQQRFEGKPRACEDGVGEYNRVPADHLRSGNPD